MQTRPVACGKFREERRKFGGKKETTRNANFRVRLPRASSACKYILLALLHTDTLDIIYPTRELDGPLNYTTVASLLKNFILRVALRARKKHADRHARVRKFTDITWRERDGATYVQFHVSAVAYLWIYWNDTRGSDSNGLAKNCLCMVTRRNVKENYRRVM